MKFLSIRFFFIKLFLLFFLSGISQENFLLTVYFESGSAIINPGEANTLDTLVQKLADGNKKYRWGIIGNTDNVGSMVYNDSLSMARSISCLNYLLKAGIDTVHLVIEAKGFKNPVATNSTEVGKSKNRRVDIFVELWDSYLRRILNFKPEQICFDIIVSEGLDTILPSGTRIAIPPNSFAYCDKREIEGVVQFCYTEYRGEADHVLSNYPLSFNGENKEILFYESGGMFETNASKNNEPICVIYGKPIKVKYANLDTSRQFSLYKFNSIGDRWVTIDETEDSEPTDISPEEEITENKKPETKINNDIIPGQTNPDIKKNKKLSKRKKKKKSRSRRRSRRNRGPIHNGYNSDDGSYYFWLERGFVGIGKLKGQLKDMPCTQMKEYLLWGMEQSKIYTNTFHHYPDRMFRFYSKMFINTYPIASGIDTAIFSKYSRIRLINQANRRKTVSFSFSYDYTSTPELKVFENYNFSIKKSDLKKLGSDFFTEPYNDILILYTKSTNKFTIRIKGKTSIKEFSASFRLAGPKGKKIRKKENRKLIFLYKRIITARIKDFDAPIVNSSKYKYSFPHNQQLFWYYSISNPRLTKSDYVKNLSYDQWLDYFNDNKTILYEYYKSEYEKLVCPPLILKEGPNKQIIDGVGFGIGVYNYDILKTLANVKNYRVVYKNSNNQKVSIVMGYVFNSKLKGLIRIQKTDNISLTSDSDNKLILFDNKAGIWMVDEKKLKKLSNKKMELNTLICDDVSKQVMNLKELKLKLGIQ